MMYMGSLPSHKWTCGLDTAFPWASAPHANSLFRVRVDCVLWKKGLSNIRVGVLCPTACTKCPISELVEPHQNVWGYREGKVAELT